MNSNCDKWTILDRLLNVTSEPLGRTPLARTSLEPRSLPAAQVEPDEKMIYNKAQKKRRNIVDQLMYILIIWSKIEDAER